MIDFRRCPDRYRHWRLRFEAPLAFLTLDVREDGGLDPGYELKQNSYDLDVDIELHDAVTRLRFEHPEVKGVIIDSGKDRIFCAGANIRMLGAATHHHKVNFCKFTNETRLAIEDACHNSGQTYLTAIAGTAAGGGYELALATDHILLADDGSSAVSLPEVPLLGVLPGTGGLTRIVDKRKVRRDLADLFCTLEEGVKGNRALSWGLVDELAPRPQLASLARERALERASRSDRPADSEGVELVQLERQLTKDGILYPDLEVTIDRERGLARIELRGADTPPPADPTTLRHLGASFWPLALARQLDDAILHLRFNEPHLGLLLFASSGERDRVAAYDTFLSEHASHWLVREIVLLWKRTLKRIDASSRSLFALVEPGSCFVGFLAELLFVSDRSYMFAVDQDDNGDTAPRIRLGHLNFGPLPTLNGLSRLETRFLGDPSQLETLARHLGRDLDAHMAEQAGLVTVSLEDIDWDDEIRIAIEERISFSPDGLTGMEANLRFPGPETLESKIFGRLSAWQNWIFQRPGALGDEGALRRYGTGIRPRFDPERI